MKSTRILAVLASTFLAALPASAQTAVAQYFFNGSNFNPNPDANQVPTPPALGQVNSANLTFVTNQTITLGSNTYTNRTVLNRGGTVGDPPANQSGVTLNTSTLLSNQNVYSAEMIFSFKDASSPLASTYRILNTDDSSDNGLYVSTVSGHVRIFDNVGGGANGGTNFSFGATNYHQVILTNSGGLSPVSKVYLDGILQFSYASSVNNNPNNSLRFFLDNSGGFNTDYDVGQVAKIALYNSVLTDTQVTNIYTVNAFTPVPEPTSIACLLVVSVGVVRKLRSRSSSI